MIERTSNYPAYGVYLKLEAFFACLSSSGSVHAVFYLLKLLKGIVNSGLRFEAQPWNTEST